MYEQYERVTIYPSRQEAFEHEILPLLAPYEDDYHLAFLRSVLIYEYVDYTGNPHGYGASLVSNEARDSLFREALLLAKRRPYEMTESYAEMLTRTNLW